MQYALNHRVLDIEPRSISFGLVSYTTEPGGGPWTRRLSGATTHVGGCAPELLLDLGMPSSKKALLFAAKLLFEARFVGNEDHVRAWVERLGALEAGQAAAPAPTVPTWRYDCEINTRWVTFEGGRRVCVSGGIPHQPPATYTPIWTSADSVVRRERDDGTMYMPWRSVCVDLGIAQDHAPLVRAAFAAQTVAALESAMEALRAALRPPAPDANCYTMPDGECVSEKPCMHSAPPSLPVPVLFPPGWRLADPTCPGCERPSRVCAAAEGPPKYPACAAWRGGYSREEHLVSRLDAVAGFQLRPPPRQVLVLVDDQSEPP